VWSACVGFYIYIYVYTYIYIYGSRHALINRLCVQKYKMIVSLMWMRPGKIKKYCCADEWVMPFVWMSHVTHMNESCLTRKWFMSHTNASCHRYVQDLSTDRGVSQIWMSHVAHVHESCYTHVTHMNELCHTHEWVMSHIRMSHVTNMNEWSNSPT